MELNGRRSLSDLSTLLGAGDLKMDKPPVDKSIEADAKRLRWMLSGNGYFLEEQGLCGHDPCSESEQDNARREIDEMMQLQGCT